jgi:hypothetical protein
MKTIIKTLSMVLIGVFFVSACKKDNTIKGNATLTGKWLYAGSMMSSGGPQYWVKPTASNSKDYMELKSDGTMSWTGNNDFKKYTLIDSVTINMHNPDSSKYENFNYRIKGDSLALSPRGPVLCIEGCSTHFVKVKQ